MTNLQNFTNPTFITKEVRDVSSNKLEGMRIEWKSILADLKSSGPIKLVNSIKFITYVQFLRNDVRNNRNNYKKYPRMDEKDWE